MVQGFQRPPNGPEWFSFFAFCLPHISHISGPKMVKIGQNFGGARSTSKGHISKCSKPFPVIVVSFCSLWCKDSNDPLMARNGSDFLPFVSHISPTFRVQVMDQKWSKSVKILEEQGQLPRVISRSSLNHFRPLCCPHPLTRHSTFKNLSKRGELEG